MRGSSIHLKHPQSIRDGQARDSWHEDRSTRNFVSIHGKIRWHHAEASLQDVLVVVFLYQKEEVMTEIPVISQERFKFVSAFSAAILEVVRAEKPHTFFDEKSIIPFAMDLLADYAHAQKIEMPSSMDELSPTIIRAIAFQKL